MKQFLAVVIESPFEEGRYLLCRRMEHGMTTVVSDHRDPGSTEQERVKLQREYDFMETRPAADPDEPRQLVLGFYTDEDAATSPT
jgi:hypothetical protein